TVSCKQVQRNIRFTNSCVNEIFCRYICVKSRQTFVTFNQIAVCGTKVHARELARPFAEADRQPESAGTFEAAESPPKSADRSLRRHRSVDRYESLPMPRLAPLTRPSSAAIRAHSARVHDPNDRESCAQIARVVHPVSLHASQWD